MKSIVVVYLVIVLLLLGGCIGNIVKFCHCDFEPSYKAEIIRGIGIVVPVVGGVIGYMDIEDVPTDVGSGEVDNVEAR